MAAPMNHREHTAENLIAALLFMGIGIAALIIASDYPVGTLRRMGPGLYPMIIGGLLIAVGTGLAIQTLVTGRFEWRLPEWPGWRTLRAVFFVLLALLVFALLIRPAGLFIATSVLVFTATRAEPGYNLVSALVLSLSLAGLCAGIFVYGIGLPFRVWP